MVGQRRTGMSSPEGRREAEDEEEMERSHRGLGRWQLRPGVQNEELISEGTYPSVPRAEMQASYGLSCIRIPMLPGTRSLNLSNSVAIVVYDILRQKEFPALQLQGKLTHYTW